MLSNEKLWIPMFRLFGRRCRAFLKLLLAMTKPKRILEVGTAVGFSSILMAEYDPVPCEIVTELKLMKSELPIARKF